MDSVRPGATSTPAANTKVKSRKGIHDQDNQSIQSPIQLPMEQIENFHFSPKSRQNANPRYINSAYRSTPGISPIHSPNQIRHRSPRSASPSETSDEEEEEDENQHVDKIENQQEQEESKDECNNSTNRLCFITVALVIIAIILYSISADSTNGDSSTKFNLEESFSKFEKQFSKQNEDFWLNIRVSIREIPVLEQPRSIIFLYEPKSESTMNNILEKVTKAALCEISSCSENSVILQGESLSKLKNDYGRIISENRHRLEQSGVMVVRNLEKVPGVSAQAFHSICDDYNPVVKKALILFTLKVNKIPRTYLTRFTEETLLNLWTDIGKDDKFYPLFTRISSNVLAVQPE